MVDNANLRQRISQLFLWLVIFHFAEYSKVNGSAEIAVSNLLKENYIMRRPATRWWDTVEVQVSFIPTYLKALDTVQQTFSIVGNIFFLWRDTALAWNSSEYDGLPQVFLPSAMIWKPEFIILNSIDRNVLDDSIINKGMIRVLHSGQVTWVVSEAFQTFCSVSHSLHLFPFDNHKCSVIISGWQQDANIINYTGGQIITADMLTSIEWIYTSSKAVNLQSHRSISSGYSYIQPGVDFQFNLQRKPNYHVMTIMLPLCVLTLLGLLVFALPPESEERISLGVTCLLAFSVTQGAVSANIPAGSDPVPYIVQFIFILMVLNALSVAMTVTIISLLQRKSLHMPSWLGKLISANKLDQSPENVDKMNMDNGQKTPPSPKLLIETDMKEHWKKLAVILNRVFFSLVMISLMIVICLALPLWFLE